MNKTLKHLSALLIGMYTLCFAAIMVWAIFSIRNVKYDGAFIFMLFSCLIVFVAGALLIKHESRVLEYRTINRERLHNITTKLYSWSTFIGAFDQLELDERLQLKKDLKTSSAEFNKLLEQLDA